MRFGSKRSESIDQSRAFGDGNLNAWEPGKDTALNQSISGWGVASPVPQAPRLGSNFARRAFIGLGVSEGAGVENAPIPIFPRGIDDGREVGANVGSGCPLMLPPNKIYAESGVFTL